MPLTRLGTLPVSALNIGLGSASLGLTAEVTKLAADIAGLAPAVAALVAVQATPPDPLGLVPAFAGHVGGALTNISPGSLGPINADLVAELELKLAALELQLAAAKELAVTLGAGFSAGGIVGWSYGGRGAGFGKRLEPVLRGGFGSISGDTEVGALIVATESFSAWGNFSLGFETGTSAGTNLGPETDRENIELIGELSGGDWNTGVAELKARLDLFLDLLEGEVSSLKLQIQYALGLVLPDIQALLDVAAGFDLEAAFDALLSVDVDIDAVIGSIQARIDAILDLQASIDAQLSGGGLSLWIWSGKLRDLGSAMKTELEGGLPGGNGPNTPAYGLVLACSSPTAWSDFGLIFKNAA